MPLNACNALSTAVLAAGLRTLAASQRSRSASSVEALAMEPHNVAQTAIAALVRKLTARQRRGGASADTLLEFSVGELRQGCV